MDNIENKRRIKWFQSDNERDDGEKIGNRRTVWNFTDMMHHAKVWPQLDGMEN